MKILKSSFVSCLLAVFTFFPSPGLAAQYQSEPPSPPYIPLTDTTGIEELTYATDGTGYFIADSGKGLTDIEVSGRQWRFQMPWENPEEGLSALETWLKSKDIEILARQRDVIYAHKRLDSSVEYFFMIDGKQERYACEIVEKATLSYDTPLTLTVSPEYHTRFFYTVHDGATMDRIDMDGTAFVLDDPENHVELTLQAFMKTMQGKLSKSISFTTYRETREETYWEIANIPQFPGTYRWSLSLGAGTNPPEFKLHLKKGLPLPKLVPGDTLGGLLVKNVPFGAATAVPEYDDSNDFPGLSQSNLVGDVTPTGEALFWLPPGMWSVHVNTADEDSEATLLKSHFIPVQPGQMTEVAWPKSLNEVFAKGKKGRMKILAAEADQTKAVVDIAMLGVDRTTVVPTKETLEVAESGQKGSVLSVERINTPADIVLLLDSSGSMRGQMTPALNATRQFISGLPEGTRIRVVDFDTDARPLKGDTPKAVLAALKKVRANGATALYDSVLLGLTMLQKSDRPSLVVFTDGVDANHNDTGPGSQATQDEVIEAVSAAGIPVFTIGFGENSDVNTLSRVAEMSGGEYYTAPDEEALNLVFDQINGNLGSQFKITYDRPLSPAASDRPVMSIMVDNSGSMDAWPDECGGCDMRMEKTRQLLRKFIKGLPEDFLIQVATFSGDVIVEQVLTGQKESAIRAISLMAGRTTTDILASMAMSLKTLQSVPSTRRYLVYLADAALNVDDEEKTAFQAILGKVKDANISTLFIGVVDDEAAYAFEHAAQKTNGKFVVSKDFDQLSATFSKLSEEILGAPKEATASLLRVNMTHRAEDGENLIFSAAKQVDFPVKATSGTIGLPEDITVTPGVPLHPYDDALAGLVSGSDIMMKDVRVTKRLPLDLTTENQAVEIHLKEALSLSRFRGIDAPDHLRYFALTMELKNILPSQKVAVYPDGSNHPAAWVSGGNKPLRYENRVPTYLIPDIRKHFFLRWNNARSYPVSEVTWLAREPLTLPGDEALAVEAGKPLQGTLIFMAPSDHMKQSSLHLYDTNYGHIDMPISGILKTAKEEIEALPKKEPARLSDAFSFAVTDIEQQDRIGETITNDNTAFVIVGGNFSSNMQAHLDLDPKERFKLKLPTENGHLFLHLHPATTLLPLGFFRPALVTPGAKNPVRMVFNVPTPLLGSLDKASVYIDIHGGAVEVPLYESQPTAPALTDPDGKAQGVAVKIINAGILDSEADVRLGSNLYAVAVAIQDEKDNTHTQAGELIILKNKDFDPEKAAKTQADIDRLRREAATLPERGLANFGQSTLAVLPGMLRALPSEYHIIGGLDEESIVFDGQTRNGVFFFELPEGSAPSDWEVSSMVIPGLSVPLGESQVKRPALFAQRLDMENEITYSFQEQVEKRLETIMAEREALGFKKQGSVTTKSVVPGAQEDRGRRIPALAVTAPGKQEFIKLTTLDRFRETVKTLRFLPSGTYTSWINQYNPGAVLSQGWGSENDLAVMLEQVVTRMGHSAVRTDVTLTDEGRQALADLAGIEYCELEVLPAVRYIDKEGKAHTLVSPFIKDAADLPGLVIRNPGKIIEEDNREKLRLSITLLLKSTGNSNRHKLSDIVDILGGGDEGDLYSAMVFSDDFRLTDLSSDAVDIGYTKTIVDGTLAYQAVVDTPTGRFRSSKDSCVSSDDFEVVGEIITIATPQNTWERKRILGKDEKITGVFHTLGLNLPDINPAHAALLSTEAKKRQASSSGTPDALSALKWYTRSALTRFIAAQTAHETGLAEQLDLTVGRTKTSRIIMVNVTKAEDDTPLSIHMDLIYPHNRIHRSPDEMADRAFNILSGMAGARFEAAALGPDGTGLYKIWQGMPTDAGLLFVDDDNFEDFTALIEEKKFPATIVDYFKALPYNKMVMFPTTSALVNGRERWAWLEFDKETYQVVSVLDTGENGSMVENVVGNPAEQAGQYMVGVLVGIDVSLWAVSAFSLQMDDYEKILEAAEKFAKGMSNNFTVGIKMGDLAIGSDVGGSPGGTLGRGLKGELSPHDSKFTNNLLGFGNGYNDGVAYYFQKAK